MTARRSFVEQVMGMPVSVHVRMPDTVDDPQLLEHVEVAAGQCFAHLRKVDEVFSTWRSDSEVMRLRRGALTPAHSHPWHAEVRELASAAHEITDGLFTAWLPGPDGAIAYDPTGLVKGWAISGAADYLVAVPRITFCINAGGDIVAGRGHGVPGPTDPWTIGIEDPRDRSRMSAIVKVAEGGVATSGNAARGAHVRDPRTGELVSREGSFTVVGPDVLWADVWATAGFVDPERVRGMLALRDPEYTTLVA